MAENKANDGRGNFGNHDQHVEAGRAGGEATASSHDKKFYEEIGSEGGKASSGSFEKGSERAKEAGRKGGEASGGNTENLNNQ